MNKTTSILAVDDDPAILQIYSEILRTEGYEVWEASTGQQGLQAARERRPHLVLLDVMLPDLSGIEVCRQIKADAALQDVFVVLFTGHATSSSEKVDGLAAGADDYIARPVAPHELLARVRTILRLRETTAALRASEQHYRRLVEILPEAVGLIDLQGRFLAVNPLGAEMFGYANPSELLERNVSDLTRPEDYARIRADIATVLETGSLRDVEYMMVRKDGHRFPAEVRAAVATDADPQAVGIVFVVRDITERKRANAQLTILGHGLASTSELICITDLQDRFTYVNRAFQEAYGYTEAEILGKTADLIVSPKSPPSLHREILEQTRSGGWQGEVLDRRKDGTEFPISLSSSLVKDGTGRVIGLMGVAQDITARKKAEAVVRESEEKFRTLFESAPIGMALHDASGHYVHTNHAYQQMLGYTNDELRRLGTKRVTHPDDVPEGQRLYSELREGKRDRYQREKRYLQKEGRMVWAQSSAAAVRNDRGELSFIISMVEDITDRKAAVEALRQAEAKYRSIFENATEGIFQTTSEGYLRIANPALADMLGYPSPEELTASVTDLERQAYVKPERRQEFKRLMEAHGSVQGFEFEHYRKDGGVIWVSINAHAVRDASGAVLYYEGTIQDVTQRKHAEEALEMSQILQRALLDNIPDPAWLKDAEGRFLACNEPLARLLGQTREGVEGRTVFDLDPENAALLTDQDDRVIRTGKPARFELRQVDAQGRVKWLETIKSPLISIRGEVNGTVGIARDITERKWVENLLRVQRDFGIFLSSANDLALAVERLLKNALENEGLDCGAVYLINPQSKALELTMQRGLSLRFAKQAAHFPVGSAPDTSPAAGPPTGQPGASPMGKMVEQLKREALSALEVVPIQHAGEVVAALNVGSHVQAEIPLKTRQVIEALATQAGGALARIRAEQSMHTSRQVLEKTIHSLRAAIFIVDTHSNTIQECNPAANRMFGYSREEMIGQSPALLHLNEAMHEELRRHLQAAVKEKGLLSDFEFMMKRKDGTLFPAEIALDPIRDAGGQIMTWVGVIRDLSERKRTEEGLRQVSRRIIEAQEAERQRVARELHDSVNQVIASAKMRLRKVEASVALNPAASELLARCDELLVQALEENRRIAHDLRPTDLDALGLAEACRNFCRQFQARTNLAVKTRLARSVQRCPPATELNLFRIVQESLNNIEKHARARTVRLQIALQRAGLMLRIQDDGRGFDPRAVNSPRRKGEGLGLTNIRERAAILGGTCEVVSRPTKGTTITVRVPFQDHRATDHLTPAQALPPSNQHTA